MPRPKLIRSASLPYHVYARANNKEWFYLPMDDVWRLFQNAWIDVVQETGAEVHAFVLMANHFHAAISTPNKNLDEVMHRLILQVARRINYEANRINHVFGGPYKWSLIQSDRHYYHVIRYIFQNPVRAGLCGRVEEYPYSTLGQSPFSSRVEWLNESYNGEEAEALRRGLSRSKFNVKKTTIAPQTWARLNT